MSRQTKSTGYNRRWTQEEINFIFNNYKTMSDKEMGNKVNRSDRAVCKRRELNGWQKKPRKPLPKDPENNLVCSNCLLEKPKTDFHKCRANTHVNDGYTYRCKSCQNELARSYSKTNNPAPKSWSDEEVQFLQNNFDRLTNKELTTKLNRTTSAIAYKKSQLQLRTRTGRIMSQTEADARDQAKGAIPLGEYKGAFVAREYQCINCNNSYFRLPADIRNQKNKKYSCANLCPNCIFERASQHQKHSQEYVEKEFAKYGIELQSKYINNKCMVQTKCVCGRIWTVNAMAVLSGHTTRCGHCDDPKVGEQYGELTVEQIDDGYSQGCAAHCRCSCNTLITVDGNRLVRGAIQSCGNCNIMRNGKTTSLIALKLHDLIEKILDQKCEHNANINRKNVDIVCHESKIAIEYDGYYYHRIHRDTSLSEKKDEKTIHQAGYKLLRIRSAGYDIPSEKQIELVIYKLINSKYNKCTITMKSWKNAEKQHNNG